MAHPRRHPAAAAVAAIACASLIAAAAAVGDDGEEDEDLAEEKECLCWCCGGVVERPWCCQDCCIVDGVKQLPPQSHTQPHKRDDCQEWISEGATSQMMRAWFHHGDRVPGPVKNFALERRFDLVETTTELCEISIAELELQLETLKSELIGGKATQGSPQPPGCPSILPMTKSSFLPVGRWPENTAPEFDALCGASTHIGLPSPLAPPLDRPMTAYNITAPHRQEGIAEYMEQAVNTALKAVRTHSAVHFTWEHPGGEVNLTKALVPAGWLDWTDESDPDRDEPEQEEDDLHHPRHDDHPEARKRKKGPWRQGLHKGPSSHPDHGGETVWLRNAFKKPHVHAKSRAADCADPSVEGDSPVALYAACFINALFKPAPGLARRVPKFDEYRRQLRDPDTLAIGVYIRTAEIDDHIDGGGDHKKETKKIKRKRKVNTRRKYHDAQALLCALQLEKRWAPGFQRIMWLVVSDSHRLRDQIHRDYDESEIGGRTVSSLGIVAKHSSPQNSHHYSPSQYEDGVVEGIAEWWLTGEVDVAVLGRRNEHSIHGGHYAATAFTRTARTRAIYTPIDFHAMNDGPTGGSPQAQLTRCGDGEGVLEEGLTL